MRLFYVFMSNTIPATRSREARRGARLGLTGIAIGVVAAIVLRRVVASQLYEVSTLDPSAFVLVPLMLLAVTMLASYVPARRAAKIDPAVTLRTD